MCGLGATIYFENQTFPSPVFFHDDYVSLFLRADCPVSRLPVDMRFSTILRSQNLS